MGRIKKKSGPLMEEVALDDKTRRWLTDHPPEVPSDISAGMAGHSVRAIRKKPARWRDQL